MAASMPERASATPPSTQPAASLKGRQRKPSTRVTKAQQPQRTRAATTALRSMQNGLPSVLTENTSDPHNPFDLLNRTTAQQNNTVQDQNSIIESIRADLAEIKQEQRILKTQNTELHEEIRSLRTQLETLSALPPPTQTWASIAASEHPAEPDITLPRMTNTRIVDKDKNRNRQLVIDVSHVREAITERVASTEVAKQAIQQGIDGTERLAGAVLKDFRVWRMNNNASVIKFSVEKDKEAAFRQTTAEWLEPHIPGARLVGPKWHAVKADWIEVSLAMDIDSGKVSRSAMERFGTENGVEVCTMRWLGRPRPSGQHASVVVKVATKEDAEKLLRSDSVTFGGGGIMVSPFEERRTPVACFRCRRFGHRARDCLRPETCDMCGQEGHLQCETINLHCANCSGPHRSSHRECPEYRKEKDRIHTRQRHE
jgi:hypothetical protein